MLPAALILALALAALLVMAGRTASWLTERISDRYLPLDVPAAFCCLLAAAAYARLLWALRPDLPGLWTVEPGLWQRHPALVAAALALALLALLEPLVRLALIRLHSRRAGAFLRLLEPERAGSVTIRRYETLEECGAGPCTILHLSDLHYCRRAHDFLARTIAAASALEPDYVAVTGDFIQSRRDVPRLQELLRGLKARRKILFVLGNHDFWTGAADPLAAALEELGWLRLDNRSLGEGGLLFLGSEEPWGRSLRPFPAAGSQAALAVALSHDPDEWARWRAAGARLVLSGHTHGGQVRLGPLGPVIFPSQNGALYCERLLAAPDAGSLLLISRGLGKPWLRICNPPEISLIRIR